MGRNRSLIYINCKEIISLVSEKFLFIYIDYIRKEFSSRDITEFFHTTFQILDTRTGKIALTDHLEITIIDLPTFSSHCLLYLCW